MPNLQPSRRPTRRLPPAAVGGLLAVASLPLHLVMTKAASLQLAAITVAAVGAIYAGFGLQGGSPRQAAGEVGVALLFVAAALAGLWLTPWVIPLAFAAHGLWDVAHHRAGPLVAVPRWYPPFCAVFDWVFGAGLVALWSR